MALPPTAENIAKLKRLRELRAEADRAAATLASKRFEPWVADPVGFIEQALHGFAWSKQREIANSVRDNRRTAVQSCHDVGKSAIAARVAAWWLSIHKPGEAFVVTSAPTYHQVRAILWREIGRVHRAGNLPGRTNQTEWIIGDELVAFGRSPADTDPTSFQGIHATYVLVIFDEACGIAKALWDAADSLIANDASRFLAIGNPDDPGTEFAEVCKPGSGWNVVEINAFESPNFTDEAVPDWLRPLLVGRVWVEERRKKWGPESPLWLSKVLGKFPPQSTDSLIPLTAMREARERALALGDAYVPKPDEANDLGVDVARFGDDSSVIYHRHGIMCRRVAKEHNRDLMHLVGLVVRTVKETGARRVKIDDIGLGGGVTDRLEELRNEGKIDCEIIGVNVGESPQTEITDERFRNLRAELNWAMRERFIAGTIALAGDEADDALSQGSQIKYKFTSSGEIQIEAKAEMKKRTQGISPDDWDALVLACAEVGMDVIGLWTKLGKKRGR